MNFLMGNPLGSVTGQVGKLSGEDEKKEIDPEKLKEQQEIEEARLEAEGRRKDKHRQMEEEREDMRQEIRDKYNIKKRVEPVLPMEDDFDGGIGRRKKTPAEMEAEDEEEESWIPQGIKEKLPPMPAALQDMKDKMPDVPMPNQCKSQ